MAGFVLGLIFMIIGILAIIGASFSDRTSRNPKVWTIVAGVFCFIVAGAGTWWSFYQSVPTKSEGVVTSYGKVIGTPYGPGRHFMAPWKTLNIVQNTIQSDTFSQANGQGADAQTPSGTHGYCITVRLGGMNSGCADVQIQTQLVSAAIPELYANYSSYGPSLAQDVDQFVVKRELTTDLNRILGDYNVIADVSANLTSCVQKGQSTCSAVTSSQFSQFDPQLLQLLQKDVELAGKITVLDVNLQNIGFNDSTEQAIQKIQESYLQTVEATQQEKTNTAISLANAALVKQSQSLTPQVLQYDCYQTIQMAIKANFTGLPALLGCTGSSNSSNILVNGK